MEARVVHRKSKELAGYTSGQDSITWLLLIFDIIFRLHLMIMIFFWSAFIDFFMPFWLPLHWHFDLLLREKVQGIQVSQAQRDFESYLFFGQTAAEWRSQNLSLLLTFFGCQYHFPSSLTLSFFIDKYPWHFSLVWNFADILTIFLLSCNTKFQLRLFFTF